MGSNGLRRAEGKSEGEENNGPLNDPYRFGVGNQLTAQRMRVTNEVKYGCFS